MESIKVIQGHVGKAPNPVGLVSLEEEETRGTWVAQSVKPLTSAQVMISRSVSLSRTLRSVLTAQNLKPALDSVSPSLSAPLP